MSSIYIFSVQRQLEYSKKQKTFTIQTENNSKMVSAVINCNKLDKPHFGPGINSKNKFFIKTQHTNNRSGLVQQAPDTAEHGLTHQRNPPKTQKQQKSHNL
jgi:hypothetical protein